MNSRDNALWKQYWVDQRSDFHRETVNPLMIRFWPGLGLAKGSRVLVPLCGKSLDMNWLLEQEHEVVGIELSPVAVRTFFLDNHLKVTRSKCGQLTRWTHGRISILCGDFFGVTAADLGVIDAVYDHTALTALPEDVRVHYVSQLVRIVPAARKVLILTVEDAEYGQSVEQALAMSSEIEALYTDRFDIELVHAELVDASDPAALGQPPASVYRKVYALSASRLAEHAK